MSTIRIIPILTFLLLSIFLIDKVTASDREKKIQLRGSALDSSYTFTTVSQLEKLTQSKFTIFNIYKKETINYRGILLKDFVNTFAKKSITKIIIEAIDGYKIVFEKKEWHDWDIMFALRENGKLLTTRMNGPMKVVIPYEKSIGIDETYFAPKWIWAIKKITFVK